MNKVLIAALAALSALFGTLGSLFLAYDYLDVPPDPKHPEKNKDNPLRVLLRIGVPVIAGMLPGAAVLVLFSTLHIHNFEFLDVIIHVIALGALAGIASALFISEQEDWSEREDGAKSEEGSAKEYYFRDAHFGIRRLLGRCFVGLILGTLSGIVIALTFHTTVDNALTTAGSTGPITMALFGLWPLVRWIPAPDYLLTRTSITSQAKYWLLTVLPSIATLSLCVGLVDGFFNSRAPQTLYSCISQAASCEEVFTSSVVVGTIGTTLIHGYIFLVGGVITSIIWFWIESTLVYVWNHALASSASFSRVLGSLFTATLVAFSASAIIIFMKEASPVSVSDELVYILVVMLFVLGAILGYLLPIRTIQATLASPHPFSRFDATMTTCFALCLLLAYITLTNLSDLSASLLGYPHVLGDQTTPVIQIQRIAFYSQAAILLGVPVALVVGGLTRAVYRWAKHFSHNELGAIGIGLILLAFILQIAALTLALLIA